MNHAGSMALQTSNGSSVAGPREDGAKIRLKFVSPLSLVPFIAKGRAQVGQCPGLETHIKQGLFGIETAQKRARFLCRGPDEVEKRGPARPTRHTLQRRQHELPL